MELFRWFSTKNRRKYRQLTETQTTFLDINETIALEEESKHQENSATGATGNSARDSLINETPGDVQIFTSYQPNQRRHYTAFEHELMKDIQQLKFEHLMCSLNEASML